MPTDTWRMMMATAGAWFVASCSIPVDLAYRPPAVPAAFPIAGAERVMLSIGVVDQRTFSRDAVAETIATRWVATPDVAERLRLSLEQEFKALGFSIGQTGVPMRVELFNVNAEVREQGWRMWWAGYVAFRIRVQDAAGQQSFEDTFFGQSETNFIPLMPARTVRLCLEAALVEAIEKAATDLALQKILLAGGGWVPRAPGP